MSPQEAKFPIKATPPTLQPGGARTDPLATQEDVPWRWHVCLGRRDEVV